MNGSGAPHGKSRAPNLRRGASPALLGPCALAAALSLATVAQALAASEASGGRAPDVPRYAYCSYPPCYSSFRVAVHVTGTGHGTVQSSPAGISCPPTCEHEFAEGTRVTLTATPEAHSSFGGWSGGGCSGTGTCEISGAAEVSATFAAETAGGGGEGGGGYGGSGGGGAGNPPAGNPPAGGGNPGPGSTAHRKCRRPHGKKSHRKARCARRSKLVAKEARNAKLGKTVLTTTNGRTLYSLSAEGRGRFICTEEGCLSLWHPLSVPAGVRPLGPVRLGTVIRPEGGTQVTYHGHPLYSFSGDTSPGQANGEGVMDVGTWGAVVVPRPKR